MHKVGSKKFEDFLKQFIPQASPPTDPASIPGEAGQLIGKLRAQHPEVTYGSTPGGNSHYMAPGWAGNADPLINIGSSHADLPHILAHEQGHHQFGQTPVGKVLQNQKTLTLGRQSVPISLWGGIAAARSESKAAPYLAAAVPALTYLPTLISEGMASHKGYQALKRLGASPQALGAARRDLLGAFGTYGLQGALSGAAAAAPFAVKKYWKATHSPKDQSLEDPKQAGFTDLEPGEDHPILKRFGQGAVSGGLTGAVSGAALGALAPRVFGQRSSLAGAGVAARALGLAGVNAGVAVGHGVGSYEAGRRKSETGKGIDPRLLTIFNPLSLALSHLGIVDGRKAKALIKATDAEKQAAFNFGATLARRELDR